MMRARWLAIALAFVVGAGVVLRPDAHGLSFVIRAADMHGVLRRAVDLGLVPVRESLVSIPVAGGASLRARVFQPPHPRRAALVVSGLHPAGIEEPRLLRLARQLSASNLTVVTPEIPELSRFEITPAITETIERAAVWLSSDSGLALDHRVGLMGISFSGGLSIVAAGRPSLAHRVAFVFALGGHDDLPRVLRYLCTGVEPQPFHEIRLTPEGSPETSRAGPNEFARSPHDYGVAVILLGIADRLVPADQVERLRTAVRRYLFASHLDRVDKPQAEREFATLRELATKLPEPSATLLRYMNERDVVHLGARLLPFIGLYGGDPALSVSKSPKPSAPVFLLHGIDDNVIPAVESEYLANDLRGHAPVRLLLSGLISHAEADQPVHVGEVMHLASFWGDLLSR